MATAEVMFILQKLPSSSTQRRQEPSIDLDLELRFSGLAKQHVYFKKKNFFSELFETFSLEWKPNIKMGSKARAGNGK